MPRIRQHNVTAAQWSPNGGALGAVDLTQPSNYPFGENVFSQAVQRHRLPEGHLQAPAAHARAGRAARPVARRRRRARHEGVGAREGRHPLHPRLPAAHRPHRREARLVLRPGRRRRGARRVLRQGADPGRARRLVVPHRRRARDLRGARLHGLGPHQPGVHPREPERRAALHPDGVRVVDRRGARRRRSRCCARWTRSRAPRSGRCGCSATTRPPRVHHRRARAGVLPDRRAVLLRAPRPDQHRPHAVRRQAAEGPRARRPLLRLDPRARARLHDGLRARAGQARRAGQDPPQRGGARASTRSRRCSRTRTSAPTTSSSRCR